MRRIAVGVGVAMVLVAGLALAEADVDVFGRPLSLIESGRPQIVLYTSRATKQSASGAMTDFAYSVRALNPVVVVRVDLRGIPGVFQGIANRSMRTSFDEGLARYRRNYVGSTETLPEHCERGLWFVGDKDGSSHTEIGLKNGFTEALAVVYGQDGRELARGGFPREVARLEDALRATSAQNP